MNVVGPSGRAPSHRASKCLADGPNIRNQWPVLLTSSGASFAVGTSGKHWQVPTFSGRLELSSLAQNSGIYFPHIRTICSRRWISLSNRYVRLNFSQARSSLVIATSLVEFKLECYVFLVTRSVPLHFATAHPGYVHFDAVRTTPCETCE